MSSTATIKRRAKKACIACRARKVRCDVTRTGTPCTNCQLDTKTCLVKERITKRVSTNRPGLQHVFDSAKFDVPATSTRSCKSTAICSSTAEELMNSDPVLQSNLPEGCSHLPLSVASDKGNAQASAAMPLFSPEMSPTLIINQRRSNLRSKSLERREPVSPLLLKRDAFTSMVTSVPYRSHKFLTMGNAPSLTAQDLAFLEAKGALHVPERPLLDEFMRQYFLHVHPMLPLIDEGDFWDTYQQTYAAKLMPLLLFQAMVFASCTCVADSVVRSLGYNSIRAARSSFYHKTKLLFDMGTEKAPLVLSQAALLMTLWCSAESESIYANSTWLRIGIQHARFIDAHRAWDLTSPSIITDLPEPRPDVRLLKRLWGCCIVRDCFLSVGIARDTQIATACSPLSVLDFEKEIDRSEVNDAPTKLLLAVIFTRCTHLCSILSDAFRHLWHCDNHHGPASNDLGTFAKCRLKMQEWLKQTELAIQDEEKNNSIRKHCVIVHTNQLFLFYYGCLSFLSRQELLHCFASPEASLGLPSDPGLCEEMQNAILGTVMCFEELTQLDLARYCQASAMAFISIPLLFYILETKFFHPKTHDLGQHARQARLQAFINAIKECRPRYEGAEWVSFTLRYVVDMVECAPPARSLTSWTDLLAQTPSYCLILIFTVDLSLKQARIPQDHDFPAVLQGVFGPGLSLNQSPRLKEAGAGGNCNYIAANSLGSNTGATNTDAYYGFLAAEHENTLRTESTENHQLGNVLSIVTNTDSNAIDTILQDLYPECRETAGIDNQAMEFAILDQPNDTGYLEQSFETPFDKALDLDGMSLDIDGMRLDLDSALDESGLPELLL